MRPDVEQIRHPNTLASCSIVAISLLAAGCSFDDGSAEQDDLPATAEAIATLLPADETDADRARIEPDTADEADAGAELGPPMGDYELTYYWMTQSRQDEGEADTVLLGLDCEPLVEVSRQFAARLSTEGTGRLQDGRVINTAGSCECDGPCFFMPRRHKRWGVGVKMRPLKPFRTVAVDPAHVAIGQMLYIPELDGMTMPGRKPWGGFVHDGCVVADDRGGGVRGQQLDFFTGRRAAYRALFRRHRITSVNVFDGQGRCERDGGSVVAATRNAI